MAKKLKDARLLTKRSDVSGTIPTFPPTNSDDHTEGWQPTALYIGEMYLNVTDNKMWVRTNSTTYIPQISLYNEDGKVPDEHLPPSNYNSELDTNLAMPKEVGGYKVGTTVGDLYGRDFVQLFDDLLFPTVDPSYVNPSNTFTKDNSELHEISSTINIVFTSTLNRGRIYIDTDSGQIFQDYRSGIATEFNYTGGGGTPRNTTDVSEEYSVSNHLVVQGYKTWTGNIEYAQGPQPYNNKGRTSDDDGNLYPRLSSGSTTYKSQRIEGVYPLFATTSNINAPSKQSLYSMVTGNNIEFNMVGESGGNKQTFDIPDAWLSDRGLQKIQLYNTNNNSYQDDLISNWTITNTTQTIQNITVGYKRYKHNGTERGVIKVRIVF